MHNDIETPTIETCKNYWQWFSSTRILKLSPESYPKTVKKSMEDISEMVKSNLTEVQSQNRAYLIKIISYLRYLTRKGLSLREHGNDQDSNFKQLFFLPFPCIPVLFFWKLYWNKNQVKCLFSHFFVVPQKDLWRPS